MVAQLQIGDKFHYWEITSFNYRISEGNGYLKAGWLLEDLSRPDYFYHKNSKVISKQSRQKNIVNTPKNMTESEHAKLDMLERVYDCGKIRMKYKL